MSIVRLKGYEAIHYADEHGLALHTDPGPDVPARDDVSVREAHDLVETDPERVWIEVPLAVKQNDTPNPPDYTG